ncbi:MAG TPA: hypothetical protein VGY32_00400 [Solirubrobacteraceae bacterium]|nr:hypothetical protein [Solirubrobacteraceae bacterium]
MRRLRRFAWLCLILLPVLPVLGLRVGGAIGDTPTIPLNDLNTALGVIPGYPTPTAAPEQLNPEPSYAAAPRANCGPGSHPLAGVQGRVPASAISSPQAKSGWTCNLSVVGHYSSSGGFKVWRYTDTHGHLCAFYDTTLLYPMDALSLTGPPSSGVYVLDMTNSAHPVLTDKLTELPMLSPHESLYLNPRRGLLAADLGNPTSYPGLMSIYDVSQDCRHPVLDSTYRAARFGHESAFSPDGRTFWVTGGGEGIAAVDVSDPKNPHTLWEGNEYSHGGSISDDGNRFYAADSLDGNLTTLDVSQIQARKPDPQVREVSRLTWQRVTIPQNSAPMIIHGHRYLLEFDEFAFRFDTVTPADTVGAARIIDMADETHPRVVSNLRLEVNNPEYRAQADSDPGGIGGNNPQVGYAAHYCAIPREVDPEIVACSFINSGLRIFNIQDPSHPREVAYFVSPPKASNANGNQASDTAMSKPEFFPARGEVWYSDAASGFWAVHLDKSVWPQGAPAAKPHKRRHHRRHHRRPHSRHRPR